MVAEEVDRKTIAILLAMIMPGAGHIYYSKSKRRRGFWISIIFVIISLVSYKSGFGFASLELIPIFLVWALQLRAVMRFPEVPSFELTESK
jgi:hypothetical protein